MQNLFHYERFRRCGCVFGRQVQHNKRFRRHALRTYRQEKAIELMEYVDKINMKFGGEGTKLYSTAGTSFRSFAYRISLIFLTHQSVISVRTSTTLCLKIFMITLKTRLISTLIHLLKMLNSRTAMIRKVILLTQPMKIMSAKVHCFSRQKRQQVDGTCLS